MPIAYLLNLAQEKINVAQIFPVCISHKIDINQIVEMKFILRLSHENSYWTTRGRQQTDLIQQGETREEPSCHQTLTSFEQGNEWV